MNGLRFLRSLMNRFDWRRSWRIVSWFGSIDHCCGVTWWVGLILILHKVKVSMTWSWRLLELSSWRPVWPWRTGWRRMIVVFWIKVKQTSAKTVVVGIGLKNKRNKITSLQ